MGGQTTTTAMGGQTTTTAMGGQTTTTTNTSDGQATKTADQIKEELQKAIQLRIAMQNRISQLQREKWQLPVYGMDVVTQQITKLQTDIGKLDKTIAILEKDNMDLVGQYFVNLAELQSGIRGSKNVVISDVKDGVLNIYNPFIV